MLLAGLSDPRAFLGPKAISFSELQTLSHCEMKWDMQYNMPHEKSDPSAAMELGTEIHRLLDLWWGAGAPEYLDTEDETAKWLMARYNEHYMAEAAPLHMEQTNVPFAAQWGGIWLFGWFDGIVRNYKTGERWIVEFKTMSNWARLHQLPVDKQISMYLLAAEQMKLGVKGVMFDALLTTRWKTEEGEVYKSGPKKGQPKEFHPPADSFRREWVTRDVKQKFDFIEELVSALNRRLTLRAGETPIRNVGQACDWCPMMPECFGISLDLLDAEIYP